MNVKYILCYPILASIFLLACSAPRMVNLDPVTVVENSKGSMVYRGSYTKNTDILNTRLDLSFDWDSAYVVGKATILAKPYFYPSDQLVLNANGFRFNSVSLVNNYDKKPLRYTYDGKLLRISLDRIYTRDQKYTVFIDYVAMPNKLKIGEDIASEWLTKKGFVILDRNYSRKWGEIDIVARGTGNLLHFVEVKSVSYETRRNLEWSVARETYRPEENVHVNKQKRLKKAIQTWILDRRYKGLFQIDIIVVRVVLDEKFARVYYLDNVIFE